jgi:octaprenyl-diphosphate synthase
MNPIEKIKAPVQREIEEFEDKFRASMRSHVPLLDKITSYILKRKGKQIRPLFVFLTAKMCGGVTESSYHAAALIELLHTATLVHDDVVDDSNIRRGFFSVNALWKNKIAVLVGDYLLSRGLLLSVNKSEYKLLEIVSNAVKEMSEGELLQIEKARGLDIAEAVYFEVIRQKTASLIASCCACGAASAGSDDQTIRRMHRFGELTGMAFQVKDDLFDYTSSNGLGKPTGMDIQERKMTLPLIFALNHSGPLHKRKIMQIVRNENHNPQKVAKVIDFVTRSGGIEYAEKKMHEYRQQALEMISGVEKNNEARDSLEQLVIFTTERKN